MEKLEFLHVYLITWLFLLIFLLFLNFQESILPKNFLCYGIFFPFLLLILVISVNASFFMCYKHSSLTVKIGKQIKIMFDRINSRWTTSSPRGCPTWRAALVAGDCGGTAILTLAGWIFVEFFFMSVISTCCRQSAKNSAWVDVVLNGIFFDITNMFDTNMFDDTITFSIF